MNDDTAPFMRHAMADQFAKLVVESLNPKDWDVLLLWKAYVKRIRPVPIRVLSAAVVAYRNGERGAGIQIEDVNDVKLVMDKVGDLAWNMLDDAARREWLLKV